jgi:4-hydroxy-tetrahydrodipicolinate synthase
MAELTPIRGVWTALITPFLPDLKIDWPSFEKLLEDQAKAGIKGVVISGTTGESPTLDTSEKCELIRFAKDKLPADVKIMAGTGCNNTKKSIELSRKAAECGADSLLVVTPPYNKPTLKGLLSHFSQIAEATDLPVCLYHVPGRTGQLLSAGEIAAIASIPNITAVKEASADLGLFSRSLLATRGIGSEACFLSGDDPTFLPSMTLGGEGLISVISNVFPKATVAMWELFKSGDLDTALKIHNILLDSIDKMFIEANPGPVKHALYLKGICQDVLRSPLVNVEASSSELIKGSIDQAAKNLESLGDFL